MAFFDFDEYERLVVASKAIDQVAYLIVLLGAEAGLRCGEMIALEWRDVDLDKRQLCVQRSDWNGQVTVPKGGIQELAGHRELGMTQRYMHLSPAALDSAIRLLDQPTVLQSFGDILETGRGSEGKING